MATRPKAVVAIGTAAATWLTPRLPADVKLTYCMIADPDGARLTGKKSIHGVDMAVPIPEQFALIGKSTPGCRRLGLLYQSDNATSLALMEQARASLPEGWTIEAVALGEHATVSDALDELLSRHIDMVWTTPDSAVYNSKSVRSLLVKSLRSRTPVFGFSTSFVRSGSLLGVGIDPTAHGAQAGALTHRVLEGAKVDSRRPEPPVFMIAINLTVAARLSIDLPPSVTTHADQVFH